MLCVVCSRQDSVQRASLASLFAPPDDDNTAAASGSDLASGHGEGRVSFADGAGSRSEVELAERRPEVGPRVSIFGPLPDIPR